MVAAFQPIIDLADDLVLAVNAFGDESFTGSEVAALGTAIDALENAIANVGDSAIPQTELVAVLAAGALAKVDLVEIDKRLEDLQILLDWESRFPAPTTAGITAGASFADVAEAFKADPQPLQNLVILYEDAQIVARSFGLGLDSELSPMRDMLDSISRLAAYVNYLPDTDVSIAEVVAGYTENLAEYDSIANAKATPDKPARVDDIRERANADAKLS